jgi:hypothetical protein
MPSKDPKDKLGDLEERRKESSKDRDDIGAFMRKNRKIESKMEQK